MKSANPEDKSLTVQQASDGADVPISKSETSNSTMAMLAVIERAAGNKEVDVEKMERLFALQERMLAKQAEEKFNDAMKAVQSEVPRILRDATNPSTSSKYTRLESLLKIIVPIYTQHGFSISFGTADCPIQNHYRITAKVSLGGHSEKYQCDIPADTVGMKGSANKTPTHGFGSTMSYGRRYLTLLIFNIALVNEDDDARGNQKPQNPSALEPDAAKKAIRELVTKIWEAMATVRGDKKDWNIANQWLWKNEILDAAVEGEAMPHLSEEKLKMVLEKVTKKLKPA